MADDALNPETLPLKAEQATVEATVESTAHGGAESSCNHYNLETSGLASDVDGDKSLEEAEDLMERGSKAAKENDYTEATECYSRALEIRAAHYGELAPECVNSYYKYGCALLYKAQEEADPLGTVPKEDGESQQVSSKIGPFSNGELEGSSYREGVPDNACSGKNKEDSEEESEAESAEGDDESDLDLAWKMLDVARAIVEKHSGDTVEKVDILSALAEVALEREDIETSLGDYLKALDILESLVEPDSRRIAELNFRICLCLEMGSRAQEAIPYCQKAISICKSRVQRLSSDLKCLPESTVPDHTFQLSSKLQSNDSVAEKEAEIETLNDLSSELEKKLEDLQQLVSNPTSILSDILEMISAKARGTEKNAPPSVTSSSQLVVPSTSGNLDYPTVSSAQTNGAAGVTNLGVVGRGVKRVIMNSITTESSPLKKTGLDPTGDKVDGKAS
ncbi:hypothetical protein Vadar_026022 [Vaccinium darrowii]|uniref:Uncharacterized protein n=1 Tax=Vaccinium darrowii TaxID=229202 RepID=A0ACB7YG42_9ERIC|nr:hypothetical protein Vadar_026022 [Vaccinium darrowii]